MADAANEANGGGEAVVLVSSNNTDENVQNEQNENSENAIVEKEVNEGTKMDVDIIDGTAAAETSAAVAGSENQQSEGSCVQDAATGAVSSETQGTNDEVVPPEVKTEKIDEGAALNEEKVRESPADPASVAKDGGLEGNPQVKTKVKVEVKDEKEDGDRDAYMVVEEADGDDNDSSMSSSDDDDEELTENERLRKANLELSERLALLEEFIEVEFSDKFGKFMKKRAHLVDVMGLGQQNADLKSNGKRSSKSMELVGLLKLVNDQARTNGRNQSPRKNHKQENATAGSSTHNSASTSRRQQPTSGAVADIKTKKEEASSDATAKRCHRCRATGHLVRECPLPIDPRDRRVILLKEKRDSRKAKRERDRTEGMQNPKIKAMRDRRRRIGRELKRERQKMK